MAENPEQRFERAMNRLFSTKSTSAPATSSAGPSTPSRVSSIPPVDVQEQTKAVTSKAVPISRPPRAATSKSTPGLGAGQPTCRPWDRGDLLRRLATFKSITWFGKPQVAGPVACARRGWVNVDMDLLACEGCGARLSFPVPPSWTKLQVDRAAETFGEKLESGHKGLCPWKGNPCSPSLALFPPTPVSALVGSYYDRCEALLQFSALPFISRSAIETIKALRGPQIENILAQPPPYASSFIYDNERYLSGAGSGEKSETGSSYNNFYQAQRLIALCGWEPRVLPYAVDCEEDVAPVIGTSQSVSSCADEIRSRALRDPGPSVLLLSRSLKMGEEDDNGNKASLAKKHDPAAAVLDCSLCGASVGMWGFSTIRRPLEHTVADPTDARVSPKRVSRAPVRGTSATSGIFGCYRDQGKKTVVEPEEACEATKASVREKSYPPGVLDLSLTIAGGPPPTQLVSPAMIPPTFGPIPGFHPKFTQGEASEMGDWGASYESREPQGGSTVHTSNGRILPADSAEGTVVDRDLDDAEVGKETESVKRKRKVDSSAVDQSSQGAVVTSEAANAVEAGHQEVENNRGKKRLRTEDSGRVPRHGHRDFPRSSSVNAIDTLYQPKQENSMESVENRPEISDGLDDAISGENHDLVDQAEGTETVVQAQQSGSKGTGSGPSVQAAEPGLSKCDEVGCDEGAETNVAVISTGTATGGGASVGMGGGSVGMEGSHEAEHQGEVNGADASVHRVQSVAGEAETVRVLNENPERGEACLPGESLEEKGVMGESLAENQGKTEVPDGQGDSQEVMLSRRSGKRRLKDKAVEGSSVESRGKRVRLNDRGPADDEVTVDTTKAVIVHGDSASDKEATDGHMTAATREESNGQATVTGPGRGMDEHSIWETEAGEFDPVRQHRHFCPWVNSSGGITASSSNSAVCGWQLTVDAVHTSLSGGLAETESTASLPKNDPLVSVRKLLGPSPTKTSPPTKMRM